MRRWAWILAALSTACPPIARATSLVALLPDGNGGLTAFVTVASKAIYAIPIDPGGVSHPERASAVLPGFAPEYLHGVERTDAGYLMSYTDAARIRYLRPLAANFSALAPPLALGSDSPLATPFACNGDLCIISRPVEQTLEIVDTMGVQRAQLPLIQNHRIDAAIGEGFGVLWEKGTSNPTSTSWELHIEFINHASRITGTTVLATRSTSFPALAMAPHQLGAIVFWGDKNQIHAAVVRTDGTIAAQATYAAPSADVASIYAAASGGQIVVAFSMYVKGGGINPPFPPPVYEAYAMRISESLAVLDEPIAFAPNAVDSRTGRIVASGDAFFVPSSVTYTLYPESLPYNWYAVYQNDLLRIPITGPVDPKASVPLNLSPAGHRRPISH